MANRQMETDDTTTICVSAGAQQCVEDDNDHMPFEFDAHQPIRGRHLPFARHRCPPSVSQLTERPGQGYVLVS